MKREEPHDDVVHRGHKLGERVDERDPISSLLVSGLFSTETC